jgi:hypothetical protein
LWPAARWARWALVFLLAFTLLRGVVWGMTFPDFFGPDEDYHFLYVEYITTQQALVSPHKPLYPDEYGRLIDLMHYNDYGLGPRPTFPGDPHASVRAAGMFPASARQPRYFGRGVGVVHPPLYHLGGAAVNRALDGASVFTRVAAVKWYTAFWGVAAVFFAWLLAAQVFRREQHQLLAAFLVAVQPMVSLLSGIANHDEALIATFTAALAMMAFMLRSPPALRQGAWLGGAISLALLVKGTALVLLPLAALAYVGQALSHRGDRSTVLRSAALAAALVLVLAGWWYVRSEILYGSLAGYTASQIPQAAGHGSTTLGHLLSLIKQWVTLTYRTYWWHHFWYEAPRASFVYYIPAIVGGIGIVGLTRLAFARRRTLLGTETPLLRQAVLLTLAALLVWLSVMYTDIQRNIHGAGFELTGGRYLLPAYPAVAILLIAGVRELTPRLPRLQPVALSALALLAGWFCWHTWTVNYAYRYYGRVDNGHIVPPLGGWHELFRRMSFDRPEFITPTTFEVLFVLIFGCLAAAVVSVLLGSSGGPRALRLRRRSSEAGPSLALGAGPGE